MDNIILIITTTATSTIMAVIDIVCIIWIIPNATIICWDYKVNANSNGGSKLNQNVIVYHTVNNTITIMCVIKDCNGMDANVTKITSIYQIARGLSNFDLIIAVISVYDMILYRTQASIAIYSPCGAYLLIVVDHIGQHAIRFRIFKFNTSS